MGDYKPYIVKSTDRGRTWTNITGNLGGKNNVWTIAQDHVNGDLLFAGTEFGLYVTVDGGRNWTQLKGGMPTTQVRDLTLHKRESDVVMGTFGRGFFVLDDYSAFREITPQSLNEEARLYPLRHAYNFQPGGVAPAGAAGVLAISGNFSTPNPPVCAWMTYHVKTALPADTKLVLSITDNTGKLIRRCELDKTAGLRRFAWNLVNDPVPPDSLAIARMVAQAGAALTPEMRAQADSAMRNPNRPRTVTACTGGFGGGGFGGGGGGGGGGFNPAQFGAFLRGGQGTRVPNGLYKASIGKMVGDKVTPIGPTQTFSVMALLEP
jgi:hypothetical protein